MHFIDFAAKEGIVHVLQSNQMPFADVNSRNCEENKTLALVSVNGVTFAAKC